MSYIKSYLDHTRRQNEDIKNIHAVLLASVLTGFFIVIYLFLVRGVTPPHPEISITSNRTYTNNSEYNNLNQKNPEQNIYNNSDNSNLNINNLNKNNLPADFNPFQSIKDIFEKASTDINNIKNNVGGSEYKSDVKNR